MKVKRMLEEAVTRGPLSRSVSAAILEVAVREDEERSQCLCRGREALKPHNFDAIAFKQSARVDSSSSSVEAEDECFYRRRSEHHNCQLLTASSKAALMGSMEIPLAIAQSWMRIRLDKWKKEVEKEQTLPCEDISDNMASDLALPGDRESECMHATDVCEDQTVDAPITRLIKLGNSGVLTVEETTI